MKVRLPLACVFLFMVICASAQSETPLDSIVEEASEPTAWQKIRKGVYINLNGKMMPNPENYQLSSEMGFGVSILSFELGFFISQFHGEHTRRLIFPNDFELDYLYGGVQLGLKVFESKHFESQLVLGYGWGDMTWTRDESNFAFSRDKYSVFHPEVRFAYVPLEFVTLYLQPGFRIMNGLELSGLTKDDFSGFTLAAGFNIRLHR